MLNTTVNVADTTDTWSISGVIDDALRALRINGSLLLRESYTPPWSIAVPNSNRLAALLGVNSGARVVAFHLVEFGHCVIQPDTGSDVLLTAGDMAICFGGGAHKLVQGNPSKPQAIEDLLAGGRNLQRPDASDRQSGAALLCGVFLLHHTSFNPLFAALPPLMRTTLSRSGELHNLSGVARLMTEEMDRQSPGGGYVVERLLEVLCAEAVRAHMEAVPCHEAGWFRGIKDPVVGRAIAVMHAHPGEAWSVPRLAADVAMSPSRFAARFSASVGDSPMAYLTKWRMNLACRALTTTHQSVDQIAADAGYESPAAFSRAFKKHVGVSPATWRTHELAKNRFFAMN
jgi:AraC-like DNA-binding protein